MVKKIITLLIKFIYFIIEKVEYIEFRNHSLDENDIDKKIIRTTDIDNLKVMSDTGWVDVTNIHETQPYKLYDIKLENGYKLACADNHIIFKNDLTESLADPEKSTSQSATTRSRPFTDAFKISSFLINK